MCDRHRNDFDIEVKVIPRDRLSASQMSMYKDFVLFDENLFYQVQAPTLSSENRAAVAVTRLSIREADLNSADNYFTGLWILNSLY
jgi:hypothetical protein